MIEHIRYHHIPSGNAGILVTLRLMRDMIVSSPPMVRRATEAALDSMHVQVNDPSLRLAALYRWVQQHMVYTPDRTGVMTVDGITDVLDEELRSAEYLLGRINEGGVAYGDCDDYVLLLGSMLYSIGIPPVLVVTSAQPSGIYDHVFLRVGNTIADGITNQPLGWHIPWERVTNRMEFLV